MVVLEMFKLPDKKILVKVLVCLIIAFLGVVGLIVHDTLMEQNVIVSEKDEEAVKREARDRALYNSTLEDLINSHGLSNLYTLLNDVYKDKYALKDSGWDLQESLCTGDICTTRYMRQPNSMFNYVVQRKGDITYEPIFNQNELTFEGVAYPVGERDNLYYNDKLDNIMSCNEFITEVYRLDQVLSFNTGKTLTLSPPEILMNFATAYDWAHHINIKKGNITATISDLGKIKIIREQLLSRFIRYNDLNIQNSQLNINLSYYCL